MKNILLYIDNEIDGTGGAQYTKSLLDALASLSSASFNLSVIYTTRGWDSHLLKYSSIETFYFKKSAFRVKFYQILIAFGLISVAREIAGKFDKKVIFLNKSNFDLVIFPSVDTIACLVDGNSLGTIHDLMHRYERRFKETGSFPRFYYRENYYKNLLKIASAVLVDSELGKKQVIESYGIHKAEILVLPYIAPYNYYHQKTRDNEINIASNSGNGYLFYPAALCPHKNHVNLIKSVKLLSDRNIIIDLFLAGKKNLEFSRLSKLVSDYKLSHQVKFLGYIPDDQMGNYYRNALALIMPTYYGPTNMPPVEAILQDCIPVVSNNYAMPEQLEDAALYFDPLKPESIADAIESLVKDKDLRSRLLANGSKIKHKFSRERFESDLKSILKRTAHIN